ncbi:MAG: phenylalanine--tRNA ligase subunit beta, partial [Minisyncoccia bacterium]
EVNGDWVIDIDVLPNRTHDCLSHRGVALELAGLLDLQLIESRYSDTTDVSNAAKPITVRIENTDQCYRYIAHVVNNIEVRESPEWLQNRLISMGQKPINALVDATNYVMFDMGQPMHVFDADRVTGGITVRNANPGETMTSLTGDDLELQETDLVIADDAGVLALAGVKGGTRAEVSKQTKNIIIESANFNPLTTRKTARRVKILTDASKRYENGISSEIAVSAMNAMKSLVYELAATDKTNFSGSGGIGSAGHVYPVPEEQFTLKLDRGHVARLLGFDISVDDISTILKRFDYQFQNNNDDFVITIPFQRLDLRRPEDMIEEIGRLYGYHNIPVKSLDEINFEPEINTSFYVIHRLKNYFIENGFTEIMNYTFVKKGKVELKNPLASDKKALRKNLSQQMKSSLETNARIADFINVNQVLNFEIDVVHTDLGEQLVCCFGIDTLSKKSRKQYGTAEVQIQNHVQAIADIFGVAELVCNIENNVASFDLAQCIDAVDVDSYDDILRGTSYGPDATFVGISVYPYMKRDISFWIAGVDGETCKQAIQNAGAEFLQKVFLFDEFEKDGQTSFAFSMIFQSDERTLTDTDVDADMEKINSAVVALGGEIR